MEDFTKLYKGPDSEALRFYEAPERNNAASERLGRPIYDTVLCVEVTTPGSRECTPHFLLERKFSTDTGIAEPQRTERYEKYRAAIEAFRSGTDSNDLSGTPLSAWPALEVGQIAALREGRVFTLEGLAALSDEKLRVLGPGGRSLRERATAFLAAAAGNAPIEALAVENADLKAQIAALTARMDAQGTPPPSATEPAPPPAAEAPAKAASTLPIV